MLSLKDYLPHLLAIEFTSAKQVLNLRILFFSQYFYYSVFVCHYVFLKKLFFKKNLFFVLSLRLTFLRYFSFPLLFFQEKFFKKKGWGWLLLYNLAKFKVPTWIRYLYFFLRKNKISVIVSALKKNTTHGLNIYGKKILY